ncbi:GNAT family N-acetyltransferase [Pseudolactococcus reticulitermitis]|uniref:N-acetyltransferase domain-containing protein n=1 Tax=Pseudolactococcus reticulitermitis TaxID=2025039 RepID=A0A224X9K3_9LACT|nr:GNAT family N-acetyltransferase [Lactococcus reticulitermitis]GAX46425.1 hypothetical protein RsY01_04 [Lactococcus reticulitermitis]
MNNKEILRIAMKQSAIDLSCEPDDFRSTQNKVVLSSENNDARKDLILPFFCHLISYGDNIVASVAATIADVVETYINQFEVGHCFETPNLYVLNKALEKHGMQVCFMAEYFLPDLDCLKQLPCQYDLKVLQPDDFSSLYVSEWRNALCKNRKELDVLAVGAFDNGKLVGLAGCSADCETMWQIGVDVLPDYRQQGIAAALTSTLALEIIKLGKVPFYCCAWSNIRSVRNAIKSGFRPAWVELTAESIVFIDDLNK